MKTLLIILALVVVFLFFKEKSINRTFRYPISSRQPLFTPSVTQRIPRLIIQTHESDQLPIDLYHSCNQNKFMNPEYEYRFYTGEDRIKYIENYFPEYVSDYNCLIPGAYRADLFRYLILYREGGVYIDCKTSCMNPLSSFIEPEDDMTLVKDLNVTKAFMFNGVIATVAGHPLMKLLIDKYIDNIRNRSYGKNHLDVGGPSLFGSIFNQYHSVKEDAEILQQRYGAINVKCSTGHRIDRDTLEYNTYIYTRDGIPMFSRTCKNYIYSKIKNNFLMKDYISQWMTGKIYRN